MLCNIIICAIMHTKWLRIPLCSTWILLSMAFCFFFLNETYLSACGVLKFGRDSAMLSSSSGLSSSMLEKPISSWNWQEIRSCSAVVRNTRHSSGFRKVPLVNKRLMVWHEFATVGLYWCSQQTYLPSFEHSLNLLSRLTVTHITESLILSVHRYI